MKNALTSLFCLLCLAPGIHAQSLTAFKNNKGLWGFKDASGKVQITPVYALKPRPFSEGRCVVAQAYTRTGVIDDKGNEVIPTKYSSITDFKNGFAVVTLVRPDTLNKINGRPSTYTVKGIVDRSGKEIVPVIYRNLFGDFSNGWFVVADSGTRTKFYYDVSGKLFTPPPGIILVPDRVDGKRFIAHKSYKYGLIDKQFKNILPFEYGSIRPTENGLLIVGQNGKMGIMNANLKWVLEPTLKGLTPFKNGYAVFTSDDNKQGAINLQGKITTEPKFANIQLIEKTSSSIAIYKYPGNDNVGLIDLATGNTLTPPNYVNIGFNYDWGLVSFRRDNKKGLMDSTGKELFYDKYDDFVTGMLDARAWVKKDNKYGFMDKAGQEVIAPQFDIVNGFSEQLARVKVGDKNGFIDINGKIVIEPRFKEAGSFDGGVAYVKDDTGRGFYIDKTGTEVKE